MLSINNTNTQSDVKLITFKLYNGMSVGIIHKKNMPVTYKLSFLAGSVYDIPNKEGTAHFLEHMLMAGSKNFPTKDILSMQIENLGGSLSAGTSKDTMNFYVSLGDPNDLENSFEVLSDILLNSIFDEKTIEKERGAIINEIGYTKNSQGKILANIVDKTIYKGTKYEKSIIGTEETVKNITRKDLIEFKNKHINTSNSSITIAGDVNKDKLIYLIEKYLTMPISKRKTFNKLITKNRDKIVDFSYYDNENIEVEVNFKTINFFHKDEHALTLLASILGRGRSSRLTKILRYQNGWVYDVYTSNSIGVNRGEFYFKTAIKKEYIQKAIDIFTQQINDIANKGPTIEELNFIKNRIIKSKKLYMQSSFDWVDYYSSDILYDVNKVIPYEENLKLYEQVTIQDIKEVANKYFKNDNWYLCLCGNINQDFVDTLYVKI